MSASGSGIVKKCSMCNKEDITDLALHYRTCTGADESIMDDNTEGREDSEHPLSSETAKVQFSWTSSSGYSYQSVTLLSAFQQSIELYPNSKQQTTSFAYVSKEVSVPIGEFDGQLVIGASFCYPVKKFLIEADGDVIPLELDISKMDTAQEADNETPRGTYDQYVTAYTTSPQSGGNPTVHYNPAYSGDPYDSSYGDYGDIRGGGGGRQPTKLLMIFTPTTADGDEDPSMYSTGDIIYTKKNKHGQRQLMPHSHSLHTTDPSHSHDHRSHDHRSHDHRSHDDHKSHDRQHYSAQLQSSSSDNLADEFSQQLSEEGFTPATVKSKKGGTSTTSTTNSKPPTRYSPDPSTSTKTHTTAPPTSTGSSKPSSHTATRTPTQPTSTTPTATGHSTTNEVKATTTDKPKNNERFSVSQIKSTSKSTNVTIEEHRRVCEEHDQLRKKHERVTAQFEGKLKKLQKKLSKYEGNQEEEDEEDQEVHVPDEIREELEEVRSELDSKEKELAEAKDRMAALENQIEEYAGTIDDQNRMIHNYTHHGGADRHHAKLHEMVDKLSEFTKKQQCEFKLCTTDMNQKLQELSKFEEDNYVLQETCKQLTADITDHRAQTKQLLRDIENKRKETLALREELQKMVEGQQGRVSSEMEALEIETLRQKCVGWKEAAERAMEEADVMKIHIQQLEHEKESLNMEQKGLKERLQVALSDRESGTGKISELQRKITELQGTRITMEEQMGQLRLEKTELLSRNAELVESSDTNKISKLREQLELMAEEKRLMEKELKETQGLLEAHQKTNLDLKDQLEKTSDPVVLDQIQEKMKRYRQERDNAKRELQVVIHQHDSETQDLQAQIDSLKLKKKKYRESCKSLEQTNEILADQLHQKDLIIASLSQQEEPDIDVPGEVGVSLTSPSPHVSSSLPLMDSRASFSSTQSLPVATDQRRKHKSGIILSSSSKAHQPSTDRVSMTSLIETTPRNQPPAAEYIPSLNSDETIITVQIRTHSGLQEAYVQKLDRDALAKDMAVVVCRKGGFHEEGVVKYYGNIPGTSDFTVGIHLNMKRPDSVNDGTFKNNERYFKCPKGHGLFVPLSKVYLRIDVS